MKTWTEDRDIFLAEEIRRAGRMGDTSGICPFCSSSPSSYRCLDCEGGLMLCHSCIVAAHRNNSLHMLEVSKCLFCRMRGILTWGLLGMEWSTFRAFNVEESRASNPTWASHRGNVPKSTHIARQRFRGYTYEWSSRSRLRLLWVCRSA